MKIKIANIEQDVSIQCRANIDMQVVEDYAEAMGDGADFPPVELFGTKERCWIGDGWHRIKAAEQVGFADIPANLHPGGRVEALRCALSANSINGLRRSNQDKRRCVEIALREFPNPSSRAIAEMCGVSPGLVDLVRPAMPNLGNAPTRTTSDGRQYPATRKPRKPRQPKEPAQEPEKQEKPKKEEPKLGPPCNAMQYARMAVADLEQIRKNDVERQQAFQYVIDWIQERM